MRLLQVLLYGRKGWFAPALNAMGFNVVFAFPGAHLTGLTRHHDTGNHCLPLQLGGPLKGMHRCALQCFVQHKLMTLLPVRKPAAS